VKVKIIGTVLVLLVLIVVLLYGAMINQYVLPITELSINTIGTFGDSFGFLTAAFSGLAFSGMLIAILLQKEELKLQRKEIEYTRIENRKSINSQQVNVRLSALNSLLHEYQQRIRELNKSADSDDESSIECPFESSEDVSKVNSEIRQELRTHFIVKKRSIILEIETILIESGVDLELSNEKYKESLREAFKEAEF